MAENRNIEVGGRLHSIATGNVLAGANEIFDDSKNKKQSDINTETYSLVNDVNERLSGLSPDQQSALNVAAKATNNETKLGYYVCDTEGNIAAKVISNAIGYVLSKGGSIKIKMTNVNTANNATLNINSTGAKALYYAGERASANNSWEAGETVEVYYDGTSFYANSVAGGSGDGAFDISAKTGNTYETLSAALTAANSILSASKKKGGMSIKFILRTNTGTEEAPVYNDKYVQYRLMATTWSTVVTDWSFCGDNVLIDNPEWIYVLLDAKNRILAGLKSDGSVEWSIGVPIPVKTYIDNAINEIKNGTEGTDLDGLNKIIAFLSDFSTSDTLKDLLDSKVDKEEGKSLIDKEYADGVHYIDNPEFAEVKLDAEDKILWAIKTNGSIYYGAGVPQQVIDYIEKKIADLSLDEYEDIVAFLNGLEEGDKTLQTLLNEKVDKEEGKSLIDAEYAEGVDYENNPEYIHALTDKEQKIIIGVKEDCDVVFGTFPSQITKAINKSENEAKAYADSKASKDQKDNIIHRVRYTNVSDNMTETVDISNRQYDNVVYVGIFVSNYLHNNKFFNVLGSEDGTIYTTILSGVQCNTVYKVTLNSNIKYLRLVTTNISTDESFVVSFNVWNRYDGISLNVAANNSTEILKTEAHFICDGVNDEIELDEATVLSNWTGEIHLGNGIFYIDSFPYKSVNNKPIYSVMTNNNYYGQMSNKRIIGISKSTNDYGKGTKIFVRESAFEGLPEGTEPYVISGPGYYTTASLFIKDVDISVENNQHKIVCINGQNLGALWVDSCSLSAGANAFSSTLPVEGCVGLRGCGGDTNGTNYVLRNTYAGAFYVGFQLGGEHLVAYELGTRFCYYGYTFGEYDYGGASGGATDTHPLTLIKCGDEGSRAFPKFVRSGIYNQEAAATKQEIDLIGWSMEIHSAAIPAGAVEEIPGAFCGSINYAAYGYTNTSKNTQQPARCNRVDVKFWANDQSGRYFKTTNAAHAEMGSTLERLGYWANIMQKYYDTDLNKMLVCTSSDNQEWRDFEGNIINDNN